MATAKKTAKRARVAAPTKEIRQASEAPKGFTKVASGLTPFWTPGENGHPMQLCGPVAKFVMIKATKKGEEDRPGLVLSDKATKADYQIGQSHQIAELFGNKKVKAGTEVWIEFLGIKALGGKRTLRMYNCAFKG